LLGIVVATVWTNRRLVARGAENWIVLDVILFAIPIGIVGARIYHVLTHPGDYFYEGADLWRTLYIWEGGNAIFGSLLGGAVGALIGARFAGLKFWSFADALAPGLLVAQALGRLGNWFNNELFGLPTTLPWGLEIQPSNPAFPVGLPAGTLFHPTFLYEMIWNLLGVVAIVVLERRLSLRWGRTFGLYLIWYGVGRSIFETIRIDPSGTLFGVRTNVWGALFAVLIGIIIIVVQGRRHPGAEESVYLVGRSPAERKDSKPLDSKRATESKGKGATVARNDITFKEAAYTDGWMSFSTLAANGTAGLPILGQAFIRAANGAVNYGFGYAHKTK
jgi:prolipoprotein diacylglyceryl transferase